MPRIDNRLFYEKAIVKHGYTAKGLNWNSHTSQHTRFQVIYGLLKETLAQSSLVDAGCGFGDLYLFLEQKRAAPKHYLGYDSLETMVHMAMNRTGQPCVCCDILHDPLVEADYYVASGSMNILNRFETMLFIERCYEASRKGFVFNLLRGVDDSSTFNHWEPSEIAALVKTFGCKVELREGYMDGDFTMSLWKQKG
jgi:SAM-dependent methyltransferase